MTRFVIALTTLASLAYSAHAQVQVPIQPVQPGRTINPVPNQPNLPVRPINPMQPGVPVLPVNPLQPGVPVQPINPLLPVNPLQPGVPVQPVNPLLPGVPVQPILPVQPVLPVDPIGALDRERQRLVNEWYNAYLGRQPQAQEAARLVLQLRNGTSAEVIQANILASPEYYRRSGNTPQGFIAALFRDVLNRPATNAEVAANLARVNGNGRAAFALELLNARNRGLNPGQLVPVPVVPVPVVPLGLQNIP
jgi:hypothetical protein